MSPTPSSIHGEYIDGVSIKGLRRLRLRASGMSVAKVAEQEGVSVGALKQTMRHAMVQASKVWATPDSLLPATLKWHANDRYHYVFHVSRNVATVSVEEAKWVIAIHESYVPGSGPATCERCGRTL